VTPPLLTPYQAVDLLARTLTIHPARAQALLQASGITPIRRPGTPLLAYSRIAVDSLAQLGTRYGVPVGGGPDIGAEADLGYYLDERNDQ
jgi:hypothetical protein